MALRFSFGLLIVALAASLSGLPCGAQVVGQAPQPASAQPGLPQPDSAASGATQPGNQQLSACISGSVVDQSGAVVPGAVIKVSDTGQSPTQQAIAGSNGQFFIANIAPGAFQLTVSSTGFSPKTVAGDLHAGEIATLPPIVLNVASSMTEVQVGLTRQEVAQEEIKVEEKQRVLGIIPNFYVSYVPNAVPLTRKQKFQLAAKTVIDPFTLVVVAGTAGVEQWQNHFIGYGQGMQGYAKRFGANYGDTLTGTFIGGAILPALLKQDPRYFYKGTGSFHSRFIYAISMAFICKGDNGRWQPNYSNVLGELAAGGISNLYYPSEDRQSAGLTFENAGVGLIANAAGNILQEFIIPKLTPHRHPKQVQQ
ncbi:MAG: carboxypeptidase-like regulatory domain-containing protein [Candidatus Sulfotelmatobacter sp.]